MASSTKIRRSAQTPRRVLPSAALLLILLCLAVAVLVGSALLVQLMAPLSENKNARLVLVTIPPGKSAREIGDILAKRHLIRYPLAFVLASRFDGLSGKMKAGRYELSPAMPPRQMAALMALGETANGVVTIPEGFTVRQIAHRLAERKLVNEEAFLTLAQTQGRTFNVHGFRPPGSNLEGYLYPDTYDFPKGETEREMIAQMLDNFRSRVVVPEGAEASRFPGGLPAVVNLASLIEREAEVDSDRPLISAVLQNRLKIGMRLQCDASVQYALPEHKSRVLYADLRVDSPYNTYLHAGLPPTPIANPGLPSIEAALHPAPVNYLFYVAGLDGRRHIFSATLAEHDRAIAHVRAMDKTL